MGQALTLPQLRWLLASPDSLGILLADTGIGGEALHYLLRRRHLDPTHGTLRPPVKRKSNYISANRQPLFSFRYSSTGL